LCLHCREDGQPSPGPEEQEGEESQEECWKRGQDVFLRAYRSIRESQPDAKEEALMALEAWKDFENSQTWRWVSFAVACYATS
jgi:crooked neck